MYMPFYVSQRGGSPFVYRDCGGWPALLPYIFKIHVSVAIGTQSEIHLHKRVPMVKIWGSSKMTKIGYRKIVKIAKVHFHNSHLVVVVVVLLLQF